MKKISILCAAALLCGAQAFAQQSPSETLAFQVKNEAFTNSDIAALSSYMTDLLGPRLAASQGKLRSEELVVKKLKEYGLSNVRVEKAVDFTKGGWDNEKTYVAMTAPYYCSFACSPKAWSGSTQGLVKGECVMIDASSEAEFNEKYKGKLAGKVVLMPATSTYTMTFDPLATRYTDEELAELAKDPRPGNAFRIPNTGNAGVRSVMANRDAMMFQRNLPTLLKNEGVLAVVSGRGSFNVPSSTGVSYKVGDPEPLTELVLPIEDHGRMVRLLGMGEKVEMELEIKNVFTNNQKINNVIAEIPGTDPKLKDEVVLIGGHLDSWHGGTGGADNASGCIVMMEALRILKAVGVQPRRTIRIALWGGEEQGLYGSRGYSDKYLYDATKAKKLPGFDKFALYLNMDNGSGRFRGVYLEQNDEAFPFWEAWKKSIESIGFTTLSPRTTGSTDHVTFNRLGLPAYQFLQDELEYGRTYHTIMDTYERLSLTDLQLDACIAAWITLCAAQDDNKIPVRPGYPKAPQPGRMY